MGKFQFHEEFLQNASFNCVHNLDGSGKGMEFLNNFLEGY